MIGFGFALFLMLVMLAVVYAQFAVRHEGNPAAMGEVPVMPTGDQPWKNGKMMPGDTVADAQPLPTTVTPDVAAADLIDEALVDRDDLATFMEDELADIEEGK